MPILTDSSMPVFYHALLAVMPQAGMLTLLFLWIACLVVGFSLTGAEVALFSLSWQELDRLKAKKQPVARKVVRLLESPRNLLASLTVTRLILNLLIVALSDLMIAPVLSVSGVPPLVSLLLRIFLISSIILLFCEFLPRQWAHYRKMHFVHFSFRLVEAVYFMVLPISRLALTFSDRVGRLFHANNHQALRARPFEDVWSRSSPSDASEVERNIVRGVVRFSNRQARQVMRSRVEVHGVEQSISFAELLATVSEWRFSRLPVYRGDLDHIVGVIHTKDLVPLLSAPSNTDWTALVRPAFFVPEHKPIEDLLQEFRSRRTHFAVVVDEFGGTEGIVTMEDILEEVIGDIHDEFDDEEVMHIRLDDHTFLFEGATLVSDACTLMGLEGDAFSAWQGESETMAGLMLELSGAIPSAGTEIRRDGYLFTAAEVAQHRILRVKVQINHQISQQHV